MYHRKRGDGKKSP
jgi:hypothetical protein